MATTGGGFAAVTSYGPTGLLAGDHQDRTGIVALGAEGLSQAAVVSDDASGWCLRYGPVIWRMASLNDKCCWA